MAESVNLTSEINFDYSDSSILIRSYSNISDLALSAASNLQTIILRIVNLLSSLY